jgi:hypothetical protein
LQEQNFELFDLEVYRFVRPHLVSAYLYDFRNAGMPIPGASFFMGQVLTGDALYFRDAVSSRRDFSHTTILKLACLFELFSLSDCAAELLRHFSAIVSPYVDVSVLLDCLTPEVAGRYLSYQEYLQYAESFMAVNGRIVGPNYEGFLELWRKYNPATLESETRCENQKINEYAAEINRLQTELQLAKSHPLRWALKHLKSKK